MALGLDRGRDTGPALDVAGPDVLGADHGLAAEAALVGLDADHAAVLHQQALDIDALHDLHAQAACGAGKAGGHQIGIGKAGLGLVADQRRIVELGDRQQLARGGLVEQAHLDAHALLAGQGLTQGLQLGAVGRADQVAALDQAGRGFLVAKVAGEVVEHRPGVLGQLHVLDHRIVGAQDARGLGAGARADLQPVQHQDPGGP